jgi:glycosyltransferase involved in cell wall biosynthesis
VVNSGWSRQALEQAGIAPEKISVVPLAYDPPSEAGHFRRTYPQAFSKERPLRVLFLGQINLRKGLAPLLEAAQILRELPVEFWFVGPRQIAIPRDVAQAPNLRWFGQVPRSHVTRYYRNADLFVFPTFSDGFGLTQLEAQAWQLPIIASRFCGEVVREEENGILLSELTREAIAQALRRCVEAPQLLCKFAGSRIPRVTCGLDSLADRLCALTDSPATP